MTVFLKLEPGSHGRVQLLAPPLGPCLQIFDLSRTLRSRLLGWLAVVGLGKHRTQVSELLPLYPSVITITGVMDSDSKMAALG